VRVGKGTLIGKCKFIASGKGIVLGERCEIGDGCILNSQSGHIALGNHSAIGPYVVIYGEGGVEIGDFCAVATHTTIVAVNHRFDDITQPIRLQGLNAKGIEIASDVWIGANCVVLDGVQIDHTSVIAAGAVVTKSVPSLSLAAGVPARVTRVIGQR
jgi:acetyltransferase-like isoleucine patch superfamily enzyme